MKQRKITRSTGFTILEILIALGTLSVAILGTIAAIAFGLRASKLGSDNTVAIQVNRKIVELIVQGIYPSATETTFHHAPADPNAARGAPPWRPIFSPAATSPRWFLIEDYGYVPGSAEAARFASETERFELDVSAQPVVSAAPNPMHVDNRFRQIIVQTRWQDKNAINWKVVRTEAFSVAE